VLQLTGAVRQGGGAALIGLICASAAVAPPTSCYNRALAAVGVVGGAAADLQQELGRAVVDPQRAHRRDVGASTAPWRGVGADR